MKIFLSGGGDATQSFLLDQLLVQEVGLKGKIIYIPIAIAPERFSFEECYQWISTAFSQHKFSNIDMVRNLKDLSNISQASAIYIGGGNTYKLLSSMKTSGKDIYLKNFVKSGGIVYGGSAGAIILGKNITTASIGKDPDTNYVNLKDLNGLNLLNGVTIHCHYQTSDDEKLFKIFKKDKSPILCLPENTGAIYENHIITIVGYQPAAMITNIRVNLDINQHFNPCNF